MSRKNKKFKTPDINLPQKVIFWLLSKYWRLTKITKTVKSINVKTN